MAHDKAAYEKQIGELTEELQQFHSKEKTLNEVDYVQQMRFLELREQKLLVQLQEEETKQ